MGQLTKVLREVEWRTSEPGMPLTDDDREYLRLHGLRPLRGMKAIARCDFVTQQVCLCVRAVCVAYSLSCTLNLSDVSPESLRVTSNTSTSSCHLVFVEFWSALCSVRGGLGFLQGGQPHSQGDLRQDTFELQDAGSLAAVAARGQPRRSSLYMPASCFLAGV